MLSPEDLGFPPSGPELEGRVSGGGRKTFVCPYCSRLFTHKRDYTVHLRSHTGERPFQCPHCPKAFYRETHLTEHLRIHTGERPYACAHCPYRATRANSLKIHVHSKHGLAQ